MENHFLTNNDINKNVFILYPSQDSELLSFWYELIHINNTKNYNYTFKIVTKSTHKLLEQYLDKNDIHDIIWYINKYGINYKYDGILNKKTIIDWIIKCKNDKLFNQKYDKHYINKYCNEIIEDKITNIFDKPNIVNNNEYLVYVINPPHLIDNFKQIQKTIPHANRIETTKFTDDLTNDNKLILLFKFHYIMWKKALEDIKQTNKEGAVFCEDDVTFIKDWQGWLSAILEDNEVEVVRFDSFYYNYHKSNNNKLIVHKLAAPYSSGAYYMKKNAIEQSINLYETNPQDNNFELSLSELFIHSSRTSIPRLAIQKWYNSSSSIQDNLHLSHLNYMQKKIYLPKYIDWYPEISKNDINDDE